MLLSLALAGCATPETRLRTGLNNAGLSKAMSACMAERMVDRLSLLQLRRLSALGSLKDKRLVRLVLQNDRVIGEEHLLAERAQRVRDVRQGADGSLYLVTDEADGALWRIAPRR